MMMSTSTSASVAVAAMEKLYIFIALPGDDAFMWNSHFIACTKSYESESVNITSTLSSKPRFGVPVCRGAE